ncbi:MAG: RNA-binding cell elongation regulator Jag/EloR [Candidatus Methylomirabilia bacterium]
MTVVEEAGRTLEEAVETGLEKLGIPREYVLVEVLEEGAKGFLGLGGREARVRLTVMPVGEQLMLGRRTLEDLLHAMGISARVKAYEDQGLLHLELAGQDSGLLIGKHGQTLDALQFLVGRMLTRRLGERIQMQVNVEQYRERRRQQLEQLALRLAEKVKFSGEPVTLEPMSAVDRRTVHLALQHDERVRTASVGEGAVRRLAISPAGRGG